MKDLNFTQMTSENRIAFQIVKEAIEALESRATALETRTTALEVFVHINNPETKWTAEGGLAIKVINKSGAASIKGYLVMTSLTTDYGVDVIPDDTPDPIGVFYESGVVDGGEVWVVVSEKAEVYYMGNAAHGQFARVQVAADGGNVGEAVAEAKPTAPFVSDKHWQEIGHVLKSHTGAGLALTNLHFN